MDQERSDLEKYPTSSVEPRDPDGYTASATKNARSQDSEARDLELADGETPAEAEQIKSQIEETRKEMGETIDAIQERLSFSNLSEQVSDHVNSAVETAKGAVYDATIGKAANYMKTFSDEFSRTSFVRTAKNNPFPFILIGLGAGLLVYQSYSGNQYGSRTRSLAGGRGTGARTGEGRNLGGQTRTALSSVGDSLGGVTDTVSNAAGTAYEKVSSAVDSAYTGAGETLNQAYHKVEDLGSAARQQYDYYLEENPLAVGAVALALGAAVGMALPTTRYEQELIGPARQNLMDKAQDTAAGLLDKTKEVVSEAGRTITDQARSITEH